MSDAAAAAVAAPQQGKKGVGEKESEAGKALLSLLIDKETGAAAGAAEQEANGKAPAERREAADQEEEDENVSPATALSPSKRSPGMFVVRARGACLLLVAGWLAGWLGSWDRLH